MYVYTTHAHRHSICIHAPQVVYVVGGKSTGMEESPDIKKKSKRDTYVYCDDLKMRGMSMHLSLMFTGNSDDVRRYVGPVVQVCFVRVYGL